MALILDAIFTRPVSVRIYGLGAVVLGVTGLIWGDFGVVWQPTTGVLGQSALGYAVSVLPLLAGLAMQWPRAERLSALGLAAFYGLAVIFLDIPRGFAQASEFGAWYGVLEHLALTASAVIIFVHSARLEPASAERVARLARVIFGVCLIYFGLAHHFFLANTVRMVPAWLPPGQTFWAYATGAAHVAAGIAIICSIYARPAAMLLTAMFILFQILVHAPNVLHTPHTHFNWAENAVNFALIGAAWVIAASIPAARKAEA